MNKVKKLGLTALAGSLASFSAYAGEVTISGGAEMTWVSKHKDTTGDGNPLGLKKALTFNYSGELDNGWTWAGHTALADSATGDVFAALTSAGLAITMGDAGTVTVGQSMNGAIGAIDDVMPTAWEETWNGQATAPALVGADTNGTHIDYNSPDLGGTSFELTWNPDRGASITGGGSTADGTAEAWSIAVKSNAGGIEGLDIGAGYGEVKRQAGDQTGYGFAHDSEEVTGYIKYSVGPITVGYQEHYEDDGNSSMAGVDDYESTAWGISFLVNDNLSVSYGEFDSTKQVNDTTADVELSLDSMQISYTMGAMSLRYQDSSAANAAYTTGTNYDHKELNISLAF